MQLKFGETEKRLLAQAQGPYKAFDFDCVPSVNRDRVQDLMSGAFVDNGENVVLIGGGGVGKTHLSIAIAGGAAARKKTVRVINADDFSAYSNDDEISEFGTRLSEHAMPRQDLVNCDLLVLNELPVPYRFPEQDPTARDMFGKLLNARVRDGRSTIINSRLTPRQWASEERLGLGTFRVLTQLHMGVFPDPRDLSHQPLLDRVVRPDDGEDLELFHRFERFPLSTVRDPHLLTEYFQVTSAPRQWHWVDIKESNYLQRLRKRLHR